MHMCIYISVSYCIFVYRAFIIIIIYFFECPDSQTTLANTEVRAEANIWAQKVYNPFMALIAA